jgi:hypothetical protein
MTACDGRVPFKHSVVESNLPLPRAGSRPSGDRGRLRRLLHHFTAPFRDDQEDLDTEMLDAFSDEWLFAQDVHHVIPLLLHFYSPRPVVILNFGFDISGVSQRPCSLQPRA